MKRTRTTWIAWLAMATLQACAETTPEVSSGSNWLICESVDDCDDGRAVRCSGDGYCLDAQGERIAGAGAAAAPEPPAAAGPGPSSEHAASGAGARDAGPVADGGQGSALGVSDAAMQASSSGRSSACDEAGAREPLVPRAGETCYDLMVHGVSSPTDTSAFTIPSGESYNQFNYAVPWPEGTVATSYGVIEDASLSVHAWFFTSSSSLPSGTVSANVLGTLLGENARMLGAWAIGGCNVVLPDDVGLELPSSGNLVVQWHHYNTGSPQDDNSVFRVCTAPAGARSQLAGITILGTENFNGTQGAPAHITSQFGSACLNDSDTPVTVLTLDPHMHKIGARMTTVVERGTGATETMLDEPFQFDVRHYYRLSPPVVVEPGESIRTTCTFENTTENGIAFGPSAEQEMCFQFAIASPPLALDNGVLSLIGATNTCW